jgi:agmatine deiminase
LSTAKSSPTPASLGFRMPAEWEPQHAVWLSWPHRRATWPGAFRGIPQVFAGIAAAISRHEPVCVNCAAPMQARARALVRAAGADLARVSFFDHPTDDAWCRDHGPIFVRNDGTGEVAVTDWQFNAWGGKYNAFDEDNRVPGRIAAALGLRRFANPMLLEGGSIDVNGRGLLLTTEACLLNPNRNPGMGRPEIERNLREWLGVEAILWLGDGIAGDDTDGHVDDIARFFAPDGIVIAVERDPRDANARALAENLERARAFRGPDGARLRVVELPMPAPRFHGRVRVPASYANYLVINGAVLLPVFGDPRADAEAAEVLRGCFPGREIVPVDCRRLVWGLGTIHCISQQQPASGGPGGAARVD